MTSPTGSDQNYPPGGAPQGQPGWGAPPSPGANPAGYGTPGYAPAPGYAGGAPAPQMSLPDAVRSVLTQYTGFSGRARRSEYWWFVLAYVIAYVVAAIIDAVIGAPIFTLVLVLGLLVPSIAVSVRRLHDTGRSGWWLLLNLIPFGGIVVLVFSCMDSQPGPNQWGPSPKYR